MLGASVEAWSARIQKKLPNAQVVGQLADAPGFLLLYQGEATSEELDFIERGLVAAGIQAWHWQADGPGALKIRAYVKKRRGCTVLGLLPLVFLAAVYVANHDVHTVIASAQRWLGAFG